MKGKLKVIQNLTKEQRKKNKLKEELPNWNILHIQIRNQGLNWKQKNLSQKEKWPKY